MNMVIPSINNSGKVKVIYKASPNELGSLTLELLEVNPNLDNSKLGNSWCDGVVLQPPPLEV